MAGCSPLAKRRKVSDMKIIYLITGSGGSFYCGNCYRDMLYVKAIRRVNGIRANAVPLYLPPDSQTTDNEFDRNIFFGAISMYLREKVPFLKNMPDFLEKLFDSGPMLKLASKMAGTTRTEGLEELTLNMIKGDNAFRKKEIDRLVEYLSKDGKPEVIHLSNALILGLARQLKKRIPVRVVCSLLNEDDWIDEMTEPYRSKAWKLIADEAEYVDVFITPSHYYRNLFIKMTGVNERNITVVPLGIDAEPNVQRSGNSHAPSIGYFSRVSHMNGFDKIVDAFIKLKSENSVPELSLHICGGYTSDDKPFIKEQIRKIRNHGYGSYVKLYHEFQGKEKQEFFKNIDLMSVPVRKHDGYGLYILEANAAGIPVVQPETGAFSEIIEKTRGGITYSPDTVEALSVSINGFLKDKESMLRSGRDGASAVREIYSVEKMSKALSDIYFSLK
jgi:glycosyltransferase involved in cell wall biosynthesis